MESKRVARQQLIHKERLLASKVKAHPSALRWDIASKALNTPGLGDGLPSLGQIIEHRQTVAEGQKNLVRWHDGTMTMTWFPGAKYEIGTWIVAKTRWNQSKVGLWRGERVMRVEQLVDAMPEKITKEYDDYWIYSDALDALELSNLMMIAPAETHVETFDASEIPDASATSDHKISQEL